MSVSGAVFCFAVEIGLCNGSGTCEEACYFDAIGSNESAE